MRLNFFLIALILLIIGVSSQDASASDDPVQSTAEPSSLSNENPTELDVSTHSDGGRYEDEKISSVADRRVESSLEGETNAPNDSEVQNKLLHALKEVAAAKIQLQELRSAVDHAENEKTAMEAQFRKLQSDAVQREKELSDRIELLESTVQSDAKELDSTKEASNLVGETEIKSEYQQKLAELHAAVLEGREMIFSKYWEEVHPKLTQLVLQQYQLLWNGAGYLYYDTLHGQVVPYITDTAIPDAKAFYNTKIAAPAAEVYRQHIVPWSTENIYPHYQQHLEEHISKAQQAVEDIQATHVSPLVEKIWILHGAHVQPLIDKYVFGTYEIVMREVDYVKGFTRRLIFDDMIQTELHDFVLDGVKSVAGVLPILVNLYAQFLVTHATILASITVFMSLLTISTCLPLKSISFMIFIPLILFCFPTITAVMLVGLFTWSFAYLAFRRSEK